MDAKDRVPGIPLPEQAGKLKFFKFFNDSALGFALTNGYVSSKKNLLASTLDLTSAIYKESLTTYIEVPGFKAKREAMQKFNAEPVLSEIEAFGTGDLLDDRNLVPLPSALPPTRLSLMKISNATTSCTHSILPVN